MSILTAERLERQPIEHELKTWQSYFHAIESGAKSFEIRRDDRDFRVGDTLWLRETEYGSSAYTGREARRTITYILRRESDLGLADGFCILSLAALTPPAEGEVEIAVIDLRAQASRECFFDQQRTVMYEAADLLSRLSAEVARVTAERDSALRRLENLKTPGGQP